MSVFDFGRRGTKLERISTPTLHEFRAAIARCKPGKPRARSAMIHPEDRDVVDEMVAKLKPLDHPMPFHAPGIDIIPNWAVPRGKAVLADAAGNIITIVNLKGDGED